MNGRIGHILGAAAIVAVAGIAAAVLGFSFTDRTDAPADDIARTPAASATAPAATPTPIRATWMDMLRAPHGDVEPLLLSCLDVNGDARLNAGDGTFARGLDVPLGADACAEPGDHADWWTGAPDDPSAYACAAPRAPALIVVAGSAGSDLLQPREGESLGLLDITNGVQERLAERGVASAVILSTAALFGAAELPQTNMERWIAVRLRERMAEMPCLRVVLIGHSHGGVTVTSVTAALEAEDPANARRMLGVLIDRTDALYDRRPEEMPQRTVLLNVYQVNEGWHGGALNTANAIESDESAAFAPVAPSDGGGGMARVGHKTLDDAPEVQQRVVDSVLGWIDAQE